MISIYLFVHPVTVSNSIYKYRPSLPFDLRHSPSSGLLNSLASDSASHSFSPTM
ncbi:unnamed protein product [Brassica napus]|uniref:(rape) hypothetical protein n=1 Tax=Brassica napus TaxID=3708 RepID=A0A817AIL8_BRANA|nr:unnamed protein product [Brassica napus]